MQSLTVCLQSHLPGTENSHGTQSLANKAGGPISPHPGAFPATTFSSPLPCTISPCSKILSHLFLCLDCCRLECFGGRHLLRLGPLRSICKHHKINASPAKCFQCREFTFLPTDTGNLILNLIRFYKQFGLFPQQSHHPGLLNVYILFLNSFFFPSPFPHPRDFPFGKYFYFGEV